MAKTKKPVTKTKKAAAKRETTKDLREMARLMFNPEGKEPYYHDGQAIFNIEQLQSILGDFTESEPVWVAQWIAYLGDQRTADRIQKSPSKFKEIIEKRFTQLEKYAP